MPEQAEWGGADLVPRPADAMPIRPHLDGDDDDYSYAWSVKPMPARVDCRTNDQRVDAEVASLKGEIANLKRELASKDTAIQLLADEVQHLREDIWRIANKESGL